MNQRVALFLDRDGVVNVDKGYVHRPEDCEFLPGIFELVRRANVMGYEVFIVTNQAGIARGYYGARQFEAFSNWMLERFEAHDARITRIYHCPHHPTHGFGDLRRACACRKPAPGMIFQARDDYGIDLAGSAMVGDNLSDMEAAAAAGVGSRWLLSRVVPLPEHRSPGFTVVNDHSEIVLAGVSNCGSAAERCAGNSGETIFHGSLEVLLSSKSSIHAEEGRS